ncbi:putative Mg2+ transporter-C (MgtC) family protein [Chitinophaga jiangningensis]|uniref:Putative Mg2+ transporter-C (MgtC) family protein n=2 Tax=Chitinophaga jiangningensis TaxID=1419482 RepID=A0A1M7C7A8_9BACT|nr:putative Mg2+ transporter-C (MgtC) family protein [Chitinophaga jiangningensis]
MLTWQEIAIRLSMAALFGALIGLERERKDWTAGMRTHMMVSVGSCLIMMVSAFGFSDVLGTEHVVLDPSRVAAQVISGIGFIGAGTILFMKQGTIRGLTTAAGLWTVAAIGLATGGGMYFAAGATTLVAIIILWALQPLEKRVSQRFRQNSLRLVTTSSIIANNVLQRVTTMKELSLSGFFMEKEDDYYTLQLKFDKITNESMLQLVQLLQQEKDIKEIGWNK